MQAQRRMYHPVVSPGLGKPLRSLPLVMTRRGMPKVIFFTRPPQVEGPTYTSSPEDGELIECMHLPVCDDLRVIETFVGAGSERCQICRDSIILV